MKKLLLAAMVMLFTMNVTAQNTQAIRQEITNSFRNGIPGYSSELTAMQDEWWKHPELGEWSGIVDGVCSINRCSIVSLSNVTSNSAKAVVKIVETCEGEQDNFQCNMDLIKENGKWVVDDYNQKKKSVQDTFREHGIKLVTALTFSDLLSIYNKRQNRVFANQLLTSKGYKAKDGGWAQGNVTITIDRNALIVNTTSDDGDIPAVFQKWTNELSSMGYKAEDSSEGMVQRKDYKKNGMPIVSCGIAFTSSTFSIGEQASM